jgi:hypothetical protein
MGAKGLIPVGAGRRWGKGVRGEYGANTVYTCVNGKKVTVETIS